MVRKFIRQHAKPMGWLEEGGEDYRTQKAMHEDYVILCGKERPRVPPYGLAGFKKWLAKYLKGEWD